MLGITGKPLYASLGHLQGKVDITRHLPSIKTAVDELIDKHELKYGELLAALLLKHSADRNAKNSNEYISDYTTYYRSAN